MSNAILDAVIETLIVQAENATAEACDKMDAALDRIEALAIPDGRWLALDLEAAITAYVSDICREAIRLGIGFGRDPLALILD